MFSKIENRKNRVGKKRELDHLIQNHQTQVSSLTFKLEEVKTKRDNIQKMLKRRRDLLVQGKQYLSAKLNSMPEYNFVLTEKT